MWQSDFSIFLTVETRKVTTFFKVQILYHDLQQYVNESQWPSNSEQNTEFLQVIKNEKIMRGLSKMAKYIHRKFTFLETPLIRSLIMYFPDGLITGFPARFCG